MLYLAYMMWHMCTLLSNACCAGVTSENVAAKYGIPRDAQDKMAVSSHQRAAKARDTGRFKDEIVPVKTTWKDPKSGEACTYVARRLVQLLARQICIGDCANMTT